MIRWPGRTVADFLRKALLLMLLWPLASCSASLDDKESPPPSLEWLRVILLPVQDQEQIMEQFTPLLDFISRETGIPYRVSIPESYSESLSLFGSGAADLAYFGGLTYIYAQRDYNAKPLVMRDVDLRFTSVFLARPGAGDEVADFRGKVLSFGSELSNSGYMMPRYFLQTILDIEPETFFSKVLFSEQHNRTAFRVKDGEADLGVADSVAVRQMFKDGILSKEDLRIIWETPTYPNDVWAVPSALPEPERLALLNAFLKLSWDEESHREILGKIGGKGFLPASQTDFTLLTQVASILGIWQ